MSTKSPDEQPRYAALVQLLRTTDTIWNAARVFFRRWDLSPSQFNILNLLRMSPGGLSQTELSRDLLMHRSNMTGHLDRLEKRGLATRQPDEKDRRAYRVVLTPAGAALLRQVLPSYYRNAEAVWGTMPLATVKRYDRELPQLAENALRIAEEWERSQKGERA
jgi:DNA-binding MarR family transcriptional regulator